MTRPARRHGIIRAGIGGRAHPPGARPSSRPGSGMRTSRPRRLAAGHDRDQRHPLPHAVAGELPQMGGGDAGRLRVLGEGGAVDRTLPALEPGRTGAEARSAAVAVAAGTPVRRDRAHPRPAAGCAGRAPAAPRDRGPPRRSGCAGAAGRAQRRPRLAATTADFVYPRPATPRPAWSCRRRRGGSGGTCSPTPSPAPGTAPRRRRWRSPPGCRVDGRLPPLRSRVRHPLLGPKTFSGRGETPHRRCLRRVALGPPDASARERPPVAGGVSRSGAIPEPTVQSG